jgi:hypothetical protein
MTQEMTLRVAYLTILAGCLEASLKTLAAEATKYGEPDNVTLTQYCLDAVEAAQISAARAVGRPRKS